MVVKEKGRKDHQQVRLGGVGSVVASEIERRTGKETRIVVLGHLQRGGAPTTFDRVVATQFGAHAVRLIVEQKFGHMICYQPPVMGSVPIIDAIHLSTVDTAGSAVQAARALGISFGDDFHDLPFKHQPESAAAGTADEQLQAAVTRRKGKAAKA